MVLAKREMRKKKKKKKKKKSEKTIFRCFFNNLIGC